jgi:osmoprotectant transport system permease protein
MGNTLSGVLIGCLTGVAAASLLKNRPHAAVTVFAVVDLIQTVPTLAMLTFIMLLFGLNNSTVICAIFLYSLFPIMRSTFTGLTGVDSGIIRAGKGIGMTNTQLFFKVELPLALPVVLSGIRIAVISALGIATTGVFVGAGGLGSLIWLGIQRRNTVMMLSGAIPVSLLAVFFEYLLAATETNLTKRRTQ